MTWLSDIFRALLFFLDEVVYGFVETVYGLFLEIANTTLFTNEMIESFAGKIYYLVGIFMLFKVSFSILTYIVNPDEFADKSKGMSKLVTNIITSLIMLLGVPFIFSQAMDIQRIVLKDNIIPKFFSTEFEDGTKINMTQDSEQGSQIALMAFKTFYSPVSNPNTLEEIFDTDVNQKDENGDYLTSYLFIFSTIVGVVLVLLFVSFCFDIALRSVKLGVLRLIAPVPIISRIDPKKGNEIFSKWTKTCVSTYLDVFMRLAAIFFSLYIIKALRLGAFEDAVTGEKANIGVFTVLFIMMGALMFAKQLPKLLEDILGIKLGGTFTLNPAKRIADVPIAGKAVATGWGGVDSLFHGTGFMSGLKRNWNNVSFWGDAKRGAFDTADHRMRKEIKEKRDRARTKYEGQQEYKDIDTRWDKGDAIFEKLHDSGINPATAFDGTNRANYEKVFSHDNFIKSKFNLDKQDNLVKDFAKAYEAYKLGSDVTVNGRTYSARNSTDAQALYDNFEKAQKAKAGLEKVHETMRKQYQDDADREDQYKFRKYNPVKPT